MEVRILFAHDVEEFRTLRLLALKTNPEAFGSTYEREKDFPLDRFLMRLKTDNDNFVVGGFIGGDLVCNASFLRGQGKKESHKGMVVAMYCHEDYRGTGIAKVVMAYLVEKARALDGLRKIDLTVVSENERAKRFYASFGFKHYGTEPMALLHENRFLDEDLMTLPF
ncbi:GNAT family N-acetyltransferase [Aliicoccus persicus]|uniref:Acetyltransferase (GNAT) family protein n=1 Tax=Aliicoccus persicus TaxID=930138 RepID=A0A662Z3N1_9STAP|nr:GNAT family N-acetyltransferase [Aliicoccus persicus]SEV80762.1 Acetyltransferase (GNAT) family protein [Aliicoccus persicus]